MNKNTNLLYCILGSVFLILLSSSIPYNAIHSTPWVGYLLSRIILLLSSVGVISTAFFSIILIKENFKLKSK